MVYAQNIVKNLKKKKLLCSLKVLKSEIECGWNGASKNVKIAVTTLIISVVMILWF